MKRLTFFACMVALAGCGGSAATPGPVTTVSPGPTVLPTSAPSPTELTVNGPVQPGQYVGEFEGYKFLVTVPEMGWTWTRQYESFHRGEEHTDFAILRPGGFITTLYAKACESEGTEFEVGPTVDDLAHALVSLEDFEVSEPIDITLSGYEGKRVRVTVPMDADVDDPECFDGYSLLPGLSYSIAGQTDDMWIIDMDGSRLTPTIATGPETPTEIVEQAEAMLTSLVLEPN